MHLINKQEDNKTKLTESLDNKKIIKNRWRSALNKFSLKRNSNLNLEDKKEDEIIMMFNEISNEIKKIDLRSKIESLEKKVSVNLDEKLYSELLSLRNQLKSG